MGWERIPEDVWRQQTGHVWRYEWAASHIRPTDVVLDAACGIGYGAELLADTGCSYVGVDMPGVPSETFAPHGRFIEADLDIWEGLPDGFDVGICFETLEHVEDMEHLVELLSQARRSLFISVPTIPTVGMNPWHVRDFTETDVPELFAGWTVGEVVYQGSELSHVYRLER